MTAQPLPARAKPEECTLFDPKSSLGPFLELSISRTYSQSQIQRYHLNSSTGQPLPARAEPEECTILDPKSPPGPFLVWTYCLGLGPRDQFRTTSSTAVQANPPLPSQARIHLSLPKEFSWTSSSYPLDLWSPTDTHWSFIYFEQEFSSPAKNYLPIWPFPTMPTKNYHKNGFLG